MTAQELIEKLLELPPDTMININQDMIYKRIEGIEPVEDTEEKDKILFYVIK